LAGWATCPDRLAKRGAEMVQESALEMVRWYSGAVGSQVGGYDLGFGRRPGGGA
jgi:hypothetical protein